MEACKNVEKIGCSSKISSVASKGLLENNDVAHQKGREKEREIRRLSRAKRWHSVYTAQQVDMQPEGIAGQLNNDENKEATTNCLRNKFHVLSQSLMLLPKGGPK